MDWPGRTRKDEAMPQLQEEEEVAGQEGGAPVPGWVVNTGIYIVWVVAVLPAVVGAWVLWYRKEDLWYEYKRERMLRKEGNGGYS